MPSPPPFVWIVLGVIAALVAVRFLIDLNRKARARDAAEADDKDASALAEAKEREAAWTAFRADIEARAEFLEENPTCPEYVISQLVGADYPRFSIFMRVIQREPYGKPHHYKYADGERYPSSMPPEAIKVDETYERLTYTTFDSYKDAKMWFDLWVDPATRQTAIDVTEDNTLLVKHFWDEMDAEAEAGV